ncbi:MAG TPA: branched-chain amino acid ABC transporter substrate-binding protein [Candidatus Aquilonibacter sp.]|nr:branched-chain amino acid ABC transporter substrate-binding protein [Candidatus Aquilonibacter sp.]
MLRSHFLAGTGALAIGGAVPGQGGFLQQINLGVSVPLTGDLAHYGEQIVKGAQACCDETNRFTPSPTHWWAVRTFDDQNSPTVATSNVFVAASDPSVIGMIGNLTVETTLAALPQYANASFALVVPSVTADVITARGYRNVFRLPTKDSTEGQLYGRAALSKGANVVALATPGDYGASIANGLVAQARTDKHDASLVAVEERSDPADIAVIVLRSNPTHVFLAGKPDRFGPIAKALRKRGFKGAFGASDSFFTTAVIDPYGEAMDGALVVTSTPPLERIPTIVSLLRDFQGEVGEVTAFSAYGYAAAQLLIQAYGRGNAKDRFSLLTQLQQGGAYNLIVGQFGFNFNGDASLPNVYLYELSPKGFAFKKAAIPSGFVL